MLFFQSYCNNDYIPTSAEVFDSIIDQDRLFATDDDDNDKSSDPAPAFLGMVLTANDDNDDDEPEPEQEGMDEDNLQQLLPGFDINSLTNILATAIHQAALVCTLTEAEAEGWFESVRAKFRICVICTVFKYQDL